MTARTTSVVVAVLLALCGTAPATVHHVDWSGGGDYLTVQEAADVCAEGDTIVIAAGEYREQVAFGITELAIIGAGRDQTWILWDGEGAALQGDGIQIQLNHTIREIAVVRTPDTEHAIYYPAGGVALENVDIEGRVSGSGRFSAIVDNSTLTRLIVGGGLRVSSVDGSIIDHMSVYGESYYSSHGLTSSASEYGVLYLSYATASLEDDSVEQAIVRGGYENWSSVAAVRTGFGSIDSSGHLELSDCVVLGDLDMLQVQLEYRPAAGLDLSECVIHGDIRLPGDSVDDVSCVRLLHNTILGGLFLVVPPMEYYLQCYPWEIRSNIVMGQTDLWLDPGMWAVPITHNDFVGGLTVSAPGDSVVANISADPLFCGYPTGDLSLQSCSPCVGAAHDGGDIGRFGTGCDCSSPVECVTWGQLKSLFRQPAN